MSVAALIVIGLAGMAWLIATGIRFRGQPVWGPNAGPVVLQFVVGLGLFAVVMLLTGW